MSADLAHTLIMASAFLILFGLAEVLYHLLEIQAEFTCKFVHFSTGILSLFFPVFIGNHWFVLFLCASFLVLLLVSKKYNFLPSINAVDRVTHGSILYPIIVYGCYLLYDFYDSLLFYYIPILILAACDPLAALVGKRFPWKPYRIFGYSKTMSGSLTFFGSALVISALILNLVSSELTTLNVLIVTVTLAFFTTLAEAISHKGYDNLTIPAVAMVTLILLEIFGHL